MERLWWRGLRTFTTGQAAKLFKCNVQRVILWCEKKLLKCWKIPRGTFRRIERAEIVRFAKNAGMDLPVGFDGDKVSVVVLANDDFGERVKQALAQDFLVTCCSSSWLAGVTCFKQAAQVLVVVSQEFANNIPAAYTGREFSPCLIVVKNNGQVVTGFDRILEPATSPEHIAGVIKDLFSITGGATVGVA